MSRISKDLPASSRYEGDSETSNMPSGLQKPKRSDKTTKKKAKKAEPLPTHHVRVGVAKATGQQYRSVGGKTAAIQSWNENVPPKLTRPVDEPHEEDPIIRAYLEAKMELFRSAGMLEGLYGCGGSEGSVSSRKS